MIFNKLFLFFTAFIIVSCGSSSSNSVSANILDNPPKNYPSHPLVWEVVEPESVGMNSSKLDEAFAYAFDDGMYTQAAIIIKDGKLVYEKYRGITEMEAVDLSSNTNVGQSPDYYKNIYRERNKDSYTSSWSTAKSFTSFLIGIAVEQGFIESIEDHASIYISEWSSDDRASITIRELLDMRSGLIPICSIFSNNTVQLGECLNAQDSSSGGNIVYADDQLTKCIERELATDGKIYPWYDAGNSIYTSGSFLYSNCDTMVLGEIIFRSTGQDIQTYAEYNLFSKIGINASWWRDFTNAGQANGNYLAYCCIDSTARDFAKFGYMLLLDGIWEDSIQSYESYVNLIKNIDYYGLKFWEICGIFQEDSGECVEWIISTIGFDGQYIMIDFERDLVVVRMSLYEPIQNISQDRKMKLTKENLSQSNWIATAPRGIGASINTKFNATEFFGLVVKSIN